MQKFHWSWAEYESTPADKLEMFQAFAVGEEEGARLNQEKNKGVTGGR